MGRNAGPVLALRDRPFLYERKGIQLPIGMIFWVLMLLWFVFGIWGRWGGGPPWVASGGDLLLFVLLFLLGWRAFGFIVQ